MKNAFKTEHQKVTIEYNPNNDEVWVSNVEWLNTPPTTRELIQLPLDHYDVVKHRTFVPASKTLAAGFDCERDHHEYNYIIIKVPIGYYSDGNIHYREVLVIVD